MPELNTFACDVCGVMKKETNRWWMLWTVGARFFCSEFKARRWGQLVKLDMRRAVACGEEHAQQLFARWLVSGSFDAPSQRPISTRAAVPAAPDEQAFKPSKPEHLAQPDGVPLPPRPPGEGK